MRALLTLSILASMLVVACGPSDMPTDGGGDAGQDAGPPDAQPASTEHCVYEDLPPTAGAGGTVSEGTLSAGAAERPMSIPVSATLGAYTARSESFGHSGFIDDRRPPLAGNFAGSVGIELWPRVRAVALTTGAYSDTDPAGDATILIIKMDLGATYQGHLHELERRLGPDFAGQIILASSHSHSSFANFDGHSALQIGFGRFARTAFDALLDDLEAVAREALANRRPARIGFAHDGAFDPENRVNRDRRGENDDLAGGSRDDHDLYVIRIDGTDGAPIALLPVFGMHGTILDADNVMASGDAPGGLERVLEDQFDEQVVVMHLQGAAGDVSPAGLEAPSGCDGREFCQNFARIESIGWFGVDAVMGAWESAGTSMLESTEIEMVTRSVTRGTDWRRFTVREGELEYAPFVEGRMPDLVVWDDPDTRLMLASPIDEFNAPTGAALCGAALAVPGGRLPGATEPELRDTPYASCALMVPNTLRIFESVLDIALDDPPLCDTTRTTVSAARIGDHLFVTLPGEPLTLLADRVRELMPSDVEHEIVIGYAQDHGGYMLTAEDWVRGGYEPNITFWGPLEGEAIAEEAVRLVPLVMTPDREDGTTDGVDRVTVPTPDDGFGPQPLPDDLGTVPAASPSYLLTRALPEIPAPQPTSVARLGSAFFTWIGADPLWGTPVVTLERETTPGTFEPVTRRSGRAVGDGHVLVTWTPDPLVYQTTPDAVHYWTVEWQAVNWIDVDTDVAVDRLADRVGAPLGTYRFHVVGPPSDAGDPIYELTSDPFEVTPGAISVMGTTSGTTATLDLGYQADGGYRMLDPEHGAMERFPMRGGTVSVSFGSGPAVDVTVDATGHATVGTPASWTTMTITDRFGNVGTYAR